MHKGCRLPSNVSQGSFILSDMNIIIQRDWISAPQSSSLRFKFRWATSPKSLSFLLFKNKNVADKMNENILVHNHILYQELNKKESSKDRINIERQIF